MGATSYIPTTGATVTRLKDVVKDAGDVNSFNSEEGVLYAEVAALNSTDEDSHRYMFLSDGTINNYIYIQFKKTGEIGSALVIGGASIYTDAYVTQIIDFNKIAVTWEQDKFSTWVNGVEVRVKTSGNTFTINTLNKVSFLQDFTGSNIFFGKTKALKVSKSTNWDMAHLTTTGEFIEP